MQNSGKVSALVTQISNSSRIPQPGSTKSGMTTNTGQALKFRQRPETPKPTEPQSISIDRAAEWFEYNHFNEDRLKTALLECAAFVKDFKNESKPRWLTLCGTSGAGKSHLAKICWTKSLKLRPQSVCCSYPQKWLFWPDLAADKTELLHDIRTWPAVVIDDIGPTSRPGDMDKLLRLLESRQGKWTLLTSNQTLGEWAEIDVRIASRLGRNGGRVIEMITKDYDRR